MHAAWLFPIPATTHRSGVYPRPSGVPGSGCRGSAALGGALPSPAALVHTMKPIWPLRAAEGRGKEGGEGRCGGDSAVSVPSPLKPLAANQLNPEKQRKPT